MSQLRALSVSTIFPSSVRRGEGVFIAKRLANLPDSIDTTVLRLRPKFPGTARFVGHLDGPLPSQETIHGLTVYDRRFFYIPKFFKRYDGDFLGRALGRFLDEHAGSFDIVDAHFAYPAGRGAVRAASSRDLPSVVTLRGTFPGYLTDARRKPIVETLRAATKLIAVSTSLAEAARRAADDDLDVEVIGNGVDVEVFAPGDRELAKRTVGVAERGPTLLTVGGLVPRKGVQRVIETLPALLERHPDMSYLVVGGGGVEGDFGARLRARVKELGLEETVDFRGQVDTTRLTDYYRAADCFVLATANEGWANVLQESLACGTPVVTTDVGGNSEVVGDDAHGTVVPFGDGAALEDALISAVDRDWDRDAISRWGRRRTWRDVGREVARVYEQAKAAK